MRNIKIKIITASCCLFLNSFAFAQTLPSTPLPGTAESIGSYSSGCLIGGISMSLDEEGIHQMRVSRGKFWGHPELVDYLVNAGANIKNATGRDLLISDLGLARGGPNMSGHVSHQNGLDVDVWFKSIVSQSTPMSDYERENMHAYSVRLGKTELNTKLWTQVDRDIARVLAQDERVHRIFVNPIIKKDLCENSGLPVEILSKFRPWYGHHDHYHVRLHCPADSTDCRAQSAVPKGDGCDELDWWFDKMENESGSTSTDTRTPLERYQDRLDALPLRCKEVLEL